MKTLRTVKDVRADFARKGIKVADWAREHGLYVPVVYDLLNCRTRGLRGDAHKAAVLLGIKDGELSDGDSLSPKEKDHARR